MKKMMLLGMLLTVVVLEGCATMPTQSELANCDNGPYPNNYQEIVKEYFSSVLFDPYSAVYKFERGPEQGWGKRPPLSGGGLYCGWIVIVGVNVPPPIKNGPTHRRKLDPSRLAHFKLPRGNHLFFECSNQPILGAFEK